MAEKKAEADILAHAEEVFLRYGLRAVTMSDLAAGMGMSKKTLYRYFSAKEDLVCAVVGSFLDREHDMMRRISEDASNAVEEMFLVAGHVLGLFRRLSPNMMLELRKYYPAAWKMVEGAHFRRIRLMISENLERGVAEGVYRKEIEPTVLARLYVQLTDALVDEQLFPAEEFDRPALFHQFIAYHMYGVVSVKGRRLLNKKLRAIGCLE